MEKTCEKLTETDIFVKNLESLKEIGAIFASFTKPLASPKVRQNKSQFR